MDRPHISSYDWGGIDRNDTAHIVAAVLDPIDVRVLHSVAAAPGRDFRRGTEDVGNAEPTRTSLHRLWGPIRLPVRIGEDVKFIGDERLLLKTPPSSHTVGYLDPLTCSYELGPFGREVLDAIIGATSFGRREHPPDSHTVWRVTEGELSALRFLFDRPAARSRLVKMMGYHSWPEAAEGHDIVHSLLRTKRIGELQQRRSDGHYHVRPPLAVDAYGEILGAAHSRLVPTDEGLWIVERFWGANVDGERRPKVLPHWKLVGGGRSTPKTWEW